jgi:hypothetical protein
MRAYLAVAPTPKPEITPVFYASVRYKTWVREQLKKQGISLAALAAGILRYQRVKVSTSALSQFLGHLTGDVAPASNTELMPGINRTLGAAPPPVCDPTNEIAQLRDRLAARWATLDQDRKDAIMALVRDPADADG